MKIQEFRYSRIHEDGIYLTQVIEVSRSLVGRTSRSAREALVPAKAEPGGSARARAPAPQSSHDHGYLSQVRNHLHEFEGLE